MAAIVDIKSIMVYWLEVMLLRLDIACEGLHRRRAAEVSFD